MGCLLQQETTGKSSLATVAEPSSPCEATPLPSYTQEDACFIASDDYLR
uniref:Uncharacterized protein n=1 Tax=Setaria italica TaxID=4555 RepID=K4A4C7_SETIT